MNDSEVQREKSQRYSLFAILLHWITVALLVSIAAIGWYMSDLPDGARGQESLFQLHKSLGISVLFLTIARITWRLMNPPPPLPSDLSNWERLLASSVHVAFYVLLFVIPLSGWIYVSTATDFQIPTVLFGLISWPHLPFSASSNLETINAVAESAHSALVWATIVLLVLHVAGAVKHQISGEDGVLHRMLSASTAPILMRRVAIAVAVPVLLFVSIALCSNTVNRDNQSLQDDTLSNTGNWVVDYDQSEIGFSGTHDGSGFSGSFEHWSANVLFDEEDLDRSRVVVRILSSSAKTGTRLYDDSLISSEWFDTANHSTILVTVDEIEKVDDTYTSLATLNVKDTEITVPFTFGLSLDDSNAKMKGQAILNRDSLNLGQVSDPDSEWVSNQIIVEVKVSATRR